MADDDDVSIRDYLESRLRDHEKLHEQLALALRVALDSQDKRLDGMNEFRDSLNDVTSRAVSRELFDQRSSAVDQRLGMLERHSGDYVTDTGLEPVIQRIGLLENWRSKAAGVAVVLTILAGTIGALIIRAIFGS